MLEFQHVTCDFGEGPLFQSFSLCVPQEKALHIVGPNGRGKTTLLKGLSFGSYLKGAVFWDGTPLAPQDCLYVGTDLPMKKSLSVVENLCFWGWVYQKHSFQGFDRDATLDKIATIFLSDVSDFSIPAGLLSGGQRRRLSLARMVFWPQGVMILDDPFLELDDFHAQKIQVYLQNCLEKGLAVILTHHGTLPSWCLPQSLEKPTLHHSYEVL